MVVVFAAITLICNYYFAEYPYNSFINLVLIICFLYVFYKQKFISKSLLKGISLTLVLLIVLNIFSVLISHFSKNFNLKDIEDKKSYSMGYLLANNIKKMDNNLKIKSFLKGMEDSLSHKKSIVNQQDLMADQQQPVTRKKGEKHMAEGKKFLEENSKRQEVKVTNSGLQYEVLKEGNGKNPLATDTVEVHYRGTLIDGTEFDSSYKRNQSISFPLNRVIKGWTEGVQLMKEGAKYKFFIPSELGYGSQGAGGSIPPNATLIFEVELIKVL